MRVLEVESSASAFSISVRSKMLAALTCLAIVVFPIATAISLGVPKQLGLWLSVLGVSVVVARFAMVSKSILVDRDHPNNIAHVPHGEASHVSLREISPHYLRYFQGPQLEAPNTISALFEIDKSGERFGALDMVVNPLFANIMRSFSTGAISPHSFEYAGKAMAFAWTAGRGVRKLVDEEETAQFAVVPLTTLEHDKAGSVWVYIVRVQWDSGKNHLLADWLEAESSLPLETPVFDLRHHREVDEVLQASYLAESLKSRADWTQYVERASFILPTVVHFNPFVEYLRETSHFLKLRQRIASKLLEMLLPAQRR